MAFDPIQEDCLRLTLEAMRRDRIYPLNNQAYIERCMRAFQHDPAQLIVHDADRAFHLVALATETIDYRAPFIVDDAAAEEAASAAEHQLREACELNPGNWDARRMLAALEAPSNDAYVGYLLDHRAEVERDLEQTIAAAADPYAREYADDLAHRPYLRWLAALASRALIAGQYRLALKTAEESLTVAPDDPADVRHTGVLALAKLECSRDDLKRFRREHANSYQPAATRYRRHHLAERSPDAWILIAELAIAYHELDYAGATRALRALLRAYPRAAEPLYYQAEFPDGVFSRVNVVPGSEDELILALSEATPLLQEGLGAPTNAGLATWIADHELVQSALGERTENPSAAHHQYRGGEN